MALKLMLPTRKRFWALLNRELYRSVLINEKYSQLLLQLYSNNAKLFFSVLLSTILGLGSLSDLPH
ncbi:MAG: hypothetical protein ACRC2R_04330 [Xenococcaceae cyanobacterium]